MTDVQYGYRHYDSGNAWIGPLTRAQVLDKLDSDLSTIPLERRRAGDSWTEWVESRELLLEQDFPPPLRRTAYPSVGDGDFPQVNGVCKSSTPPQETP